jgi:hypothetical protein
MKTLVIKIQSIVDIITNSSSELFIIDSDKGISVIKEILTSINEKDIKECGYSGDKRHLEIYTIYEYLKPKEEQYVFSNEEFKTDLRKYEDIDRRAIIVADFIYYNEALSLSQAKKLLDNCDNYVVIEIDCAHEGTIQFIRDNFTIIKEIDY